MVPGARGGSGGGVEELVIEELVPLRLALLSTGAASTTALVATVVTIAITIISPRQQGIAHWIEPRGFVWVFVGTIISSSSEAVFLALPLVIAVVLNFKDTGPLVETSS